MDLRRARYFVAVAARGSFTRAAADVHVAQSALSQQVRTLERELGVTLFDRSGPSIRLTDAGEVALHEARHLIAVADRAVDRIRTAARGGAGELSIAHTRSWSGGAVAGAVEEFRTRHPGIGLSESRGFTARNVELVADGRIDVAVVRPPVDRPDLTVQTVDSEPLLLAVPVDHRFAGAGEVTPRQLVDEPVVFWPRENGPGMHDEIERLLWPDGAPNVVRNEADDEQVLRAVAAGVGVAPMPAGRARAFRVAGVQLCTIEGRGMRLPVGFASRPDNPNPALRLFTDVIDAAGPRLRSTGQVGPGPMVG
ncbi:LysR family transcriptional regulator [Tomitella cavernea]|uniref:LysR family transcriptional regulator n=1 Tax=Tomitella cavernea TaxID=1387982 RepID=A0ABP9D2D3_9ACTN|nr:LysR family transcriptional regulator [Tomitella cavernea]